MADFRKAVGKVLGSYKDSRSKYAKPVSSFKITFDSPMASLEPIYYWLYDFIKDGGWEIEKVVDNFMASPGSGQFADFNQRVMTMQEQISGRLGQGVNQVVKSILNLIYDLKEFEIRLEHYEDYKSEDPIKREKGMLSLKQIWMDNVDIKKGQGSINALTTGGPQFVTLRDLFMTIRNEKELQKIDNDKDGIVNSQVRRVLEPRLSEFWKWVDYSEKELKKRFSIEKNYLKSQVETLKMYSKWLGPYIKAANDLQMGGIKGASREAALVNAFSTSLFEVQIMGKKSQGVPDKFSGYNLRRKYHPIVLVTLNFRGHLGQKAADSRGNYGYQFGGRVEINFDSYVLNSDELKLVKEFMEKEDVEDMFTYSSDMAEEALKDLSEDIEYFLKSKEERDEMDKKEAKKNKKDSKSDDDINPFSVIFNGIKNIFKGEKSSSSKKNKEVNEIEDVLPDNYVERAVRAEAAGSAGGFLFAVYDIYKKSHGMASSPDDFDNADSSKTSEPGVKLKDAFERVK